MICHLAFLSAKPWRIVFSSGLVIQVDFRQKIEFIIQGAKPQEFSLSLAASIFARLATARSCLSAGVIFFVFAAGFLRRRLVHRAQ